MARTNCPHCGAAVPAGALACPDCGSDESTGWASEETRHDAAWADSEEENYQDVIRSLPGHGRGDEVSRHSPREIVLAIIVVIALAAFVLTFVL